MSYTTTSPKATDPRRWWQALAWLLAALVLAGVFMLYTQPEFMVRMADHVWACF
ncbi:MAG: hypothetical protein RSD57_09415 [Comamonas sp.]